MATDSMPPVLLALPMYSGSATTGVAVDSETGQPIEGVIVVGYWELKGFHQYPVGLVMVEEGLTDAQGRFELPAWGWKPRTPITGQLESMEPKLVAFKRGYVRHYEPTEIPEREHPLRVLKLKKVPEDSKEYINGVSFVDSQLENSIFFHRDCSWQQMPHMLVALDQELTRLAKAQGVPKEFESVEHLAIKNWEGRFGSSQLQKCGSMMDFLRSYLP
jgi:hypothetical protein